jgi:hypothetical protein
MLGAIVNTLVNQMLGGGGLFGASQSPSPTQPSVTTQLQTYTPNNTSATQSAVAIAQSALDRVTAYTSALNIIVAAANTASASLSDLENFCTAAAAAHPDDATFVAAATAQASAAQSAITNNVAPVLSQAQAAFVFASTTQAFATQVAAEAISGTPAVSSDAINQAGVLSNDVQSLADTNIYPPSVADVAIAQSNASATGGGSANPAGSLTVSGGTTVDQMNLISANANALKGSVCTPPPTSSNNNGGSGD